MDILIIVLIIFNGVLLLAMLIFGWLFTVRKRTTLSVIMPDKKVISKSYWGTLEKKMPVGDGEYIIDDTCIIKTWWGFKLFYFYGNPNPINFDFYKNQPTQIATKSQDLKVFHESDLINKLFAVKNLDNIIMLLVIGSILLNLATLIIVLTKGQPPVNLSNSANNTQIIVNAVKIAIRGG
jgi:hypothetical protein